VEDQFDILVRCKKFNYDRFIEMFGVCFHRQWNRMFREIQISLVKSGSGVDVKMKLDRHKNTEILVV
jgi:hypothetical protein